MYAKFIPISALESFFLFPFTKDLEMFKIFYLLGVYLKNVYFCMIFTFVFFFERSMHIPIKIPTESIQDKEIEYFTFSYLHYTTEINISIETLQRYTKYD
jgi:predicted MPP superfamily phosphohydrolase